MQRSSEEEKYSLSLKKETGIQSFNNLEHIFPDIGICEFVYLGPVLT